METFNQPFNFSDTIEDEEGIRYVTSDMQLRILAKETMLAEQNCEIPRQREVLQRTIGHVVFELAYRTHTMDEYIQYHKEAVLLDPAA